MTLKGVPTSTRTTLSSEGRPLAKELRASSVHVALILMVKSLLAKVRSAVESSGARFVSASTVLTISHLIGAVVVVRYIAPADLGLWHSVRLAQVYSVFALAGILNGLNRELPFAVGAGQVQEANHLAATSLLFTNLAGLLALVVGSVGIFMTVPKGGHLLLAVVAVTITVIAIFYRSYLIVMFRSNRSFAQLSGVLYIEAAANLLSLPAVYFFGYLGMLGRVTGVGMLAVSLLWMMRPIRVAPAFTWGALKKLLKTGLPIFSLDYVKSCSATTDRVALLRFGGVEMVGQYALATTAAEALNALPTAVSQYTYPRITHAHGQGESLVALWQCACKATIVSFVICLGLALVGWQIIEPLVMFVAPRYDSSIPAAKLLMIAAVFESCRIFGNVLLSLKMWGFVTGLQLTSAVLLAGGPFMLLWAVDDTLTAVAGGLLISAVLRAILATTLAYLATHRPVEHRPCDQALASSGQ